MSNAPTSQDLTTQCLTTVKMLAVDAVEAANSGHPGAPMGCAEIAYCLFTEAMRYDPRDPDWRNRDRFILSNGHASMLLYSMLHLCEYDLSLQDLRDFRQWGSKTPGHPEYGHAPGVEVTTGPLGQGFGHGVGMALASKMLEARFTRDGFSPVDHRVFGIVSDGDLMEGIASEAASLAGHLGLGNLIYVYDDNKITIDGSTDLAFSEDVEARFRAYGWHTERVDGHDLEQIGRAVEAAKKEASRPSLILARTHIGHGSPGKQDTADSHGAPLGPDEVRATKEALGWPLEPTFLVPDEVREAFRGKVESIRRSHDEWKAAVDAWRAKHPDAASEWDSFYERTVPSDFADRLVAFAKEDLPESEATRASCGKILQKAAELLPNLVGGTADLGGSNKTMLKEGGAVAADAFHGRSIHYGVREHAMGAVVNGMTLHGSFRAITGTFLIFSDYMRPSMRLAALMEIPSIFVFSHDSVYLGEDGPTHQPIEHLASLRAIPNMTVWRPADRVETAACIAWLCGNTGGPGCLVTTRQGLPSLERSDSFTPEEITRGGYVLEDAEGGEPELVLVATGSEVHIASRARALLGERGARTRVVSMPSVDAFLEQAPEYRDRILPPGARKVSIEVGSTLGWTRIVGSDGLAIGIDHFGASAPAKVLAEEFGFTPEKVATRIEGWLRG